MFKALSRCVSSTTMVASVFSPGRRVLASAGARAGDSYHLVQNSRRAVHDQQADSPAGRLQLPSRHVHEPFEVLLIGASHKLDVGARCRATPGFACSTAGRAPGLTATAAVACGRRRRARSSTCSCRVRARVRLFHAEPGGRSRPRRGAGAAGISESSVSMEEAATPRPGRTRPMRSPQKKRLHGEAAGDDCRPGVRGGCQHPDASARAGCSRRALYYSPTLAEAGLTQLRIVSWCRRAAESTGPLASLPRVACATRQRAPPALEVIVVVDGPDATTSRCSRRARAPLPAARCRPGTRRAQEGRRGSKSRRPRRPAVVSPVLFLDDDVSPSPQESGLWRPISEPCAPRKGSWR